MQQNEWDELVTAVRDTRDVDRAVAAAQSLQQRATREDLPRLLELLKDDAFFVREAAAWSLSDLGATEALPAMLEALNRGVEQGHDNDGLRAALADLAEVDPEESLSVLTRVLDQGAPHLREHARWLLEFCQDQADE
jgi:HEAT repeat protein